jgi:hypothetical protein
MRHVHDRLASGGIVEDSVAGHAPPPAETGVLRLGEAPIRALNGRALAWRPAPGWVRFQRTATQEMALELGADGGLLRSPVQNTTSTARSCVRSGP